MNSELKEKLFIYCLWSYRGNELFFTPQFFFTEEKARKHLQSIKDGAKANGTGTIIKNDTNDSFEYFFEGDNFHWYIDQGVVR